MVAPTNPKSDVWVEELLQSPSILVQMTRNSLGPSKPAGSKIRLKTMDVQTTDN